MDEHRQWAYRRLLYWAMLDMRGHIPGAPYYRERFWSPRFWLQLRRRHYYNLTIAEWLHNLASFAADSFERFDEKQFWNEYDRVVERYPEAGRYDYRRWFEAEVVGRG
jgi:hypothetical protein